MTCELYVSSNVLGICATCAKADDAVEAVSFPVETVNNRTTCVYCLTSVLNIYY